MCGCDFENKVRRALSDPGGRKRNSLKEDEVSSGLHEREPNGDIESATSLVLTKERREISGELKDLDLIDWFELNFSEIGDYKVIVHPSTNLDISLFLPGQTYAFDVAKKGGDEVILATHTKKIRFALKREAKSEGSYTIESVKTLKLDGVEKEPNNDAPHANLLNLEKGMIGQVTQIGDRDVFKITTNQSWDLQITGDENDTFTLKFCQDETLAKCSGLYSFTGETLEIPAFDTQSKPLFLVLAAQNPTKKYRIHGRLRPIPEGGFLEEVEPNDTFAMEISSEESRVQIRGFLKDKKDVDLFHLKNWEFYYYTLRSLDPDLYLLGLDDQKIVGEFTSCRISGKENLGVKYGNRKAPSHTQKADYRLEIIRYFGRGFEYEPNDSLTQANDAGDEIIGEVWANDVDYFRIRVGKDRHPSLDITNLSRSAMRASLVDEEGLDLVGDTLIAAGNSHQFKMAFPEGEYFVRVYARTANGTPEKGVNDSQKEVSKRKDECRPYRLRLHIK